MQTLHTLCSKLPLIYFLLFSINLKENDLPVFCMISVLKGHHHFEIKDSIPDSATNLICDSGPSLIISLVVVH